MAKRSEATWRCLFRHRWTKWTITERFRVKFVDTFWGDGKTAVGWGWKIVQERHCERCGYVQQDAREVEA